MKVLTDTHTLVWALSDQASLSKKARQVLTDSEVTVSVANLWELVVKMKKKGGLLADPLQWWQKYVVNPGISTLSIRTAHVTTLGSLPDFHKDPFDRILVAQAMTEKLSLVTKDSHLARYGVSIIW